jgi:hypothetical protein
LRQNGECGRAAEIKALRNEALTRYALYMGAKVDGVAISP